MIASHPVVSGLHLQKRAAWDCLHSLLFLFQLFKISAHQHFEIFLDTQWRFCYWRVLLEIPEEVSKFLDYSFDFRSVLWIPYQDAFQVVTESTVVAIPIKFSQVLFGQNLLSSTGDLNIKINPISPMVQKLTSQHLIQQTTHRPNIWSSCGSYLLSPVVVICFLLEMKGKGQHFRWFYALCSPRLHVQLLFWLVIYATLSEVPENYFGWVACLFINLEKNVISFDVIVSNWFFVKKQNNL